MNVNRYQVEAAAFLVVILLGLGFVAIPVAIGVVALGTYWFKDNLKAVINRAGQGKEQLWQVRLNGVQVGSISAERYARLCRQALTNPLIHKAQAQNAWGFLRTVLWSAIYTIPVVIFWYALALFVFAREFFQLVLAVAASASASASLEVGLYFFSLIIMGTLFVAMKTGHFGFRNKYREAVELGIRQDCRASAEGTLELVCNDQHPPSVFMFAERERQANKARAARQ